jgi:ubiquitin-conjugating enzyme E2 variant
MNHRSSLPVHDQLSWITRGIELSCILVAAALAGWHLWRLAFSGSFWVWWSPIPMVAGLIAADFASGIVHWTADTWGSETMPVLGRRFVRPFRVHHVNPDDFLRRDVIDTNGDVAMIVILVLTAAFWFPLETPGGQACTLFLVAFSLAGLPTNQVHQWAHMPNPPRFVQTAILGNHPEPRGPSTAPRIPLRRQLLHCHRLVQPAAHGNPILSSIGIACVPGHRTAAAR